MVWLALFTSVVFETMGDTCMKLSDGFARKKWILGIALGYGVSFYLMARVLSILPIGVTYAIWSSLAIVLAAVVGRIIWGEKFTWTKVAGMVLIVGGIVLLRLGV